MSYDIFELRLGIQNIHSFENDTAFGMRVSVLCLAEGMFLLFRAVLHGASLCIVAFGRGIQYIVFFHVYISLVAVRLYIWDIVFFSDIFTYMFIYRGYSFKSVCGWWVVCYLVCFLCLCLMFVRRCGCFSGEGVCFFHRQTFHPTLIRYVLAFFLYILISSVMLFRLLLIYIGYRL